MKISNGMKFDYSKICQELISSLAKRPKEIITRRFGLNGKERETLESIGRDFGITRERVRQIEADGLREIQPKLDNCQKVFRYFDEYLQSFGGLRKEEMLFQELAQGKRENAVYFLLSLGRKFFRESENKEFWSFWTQNQSRAETAKEFINSLYPKIAGVGKPMNLKEMAVFSSFETPVLECYLEISKKIQKNQEKLWGLRDWPEINPKGVRDKAYLVFKKEQRPLHFAQIASLIKGSLLQTVHNELIRDPRFVLVGRGIYALKEWGYQSGQVKDVIANILKKEGRPLAKEEIINEVLKQRLVKEYTVLLNLNNKEQFLKNSQGQYWFREV